MAVSMFNCYSRVTNAQSSLPMKAVWGNMSPSRDSTSDLSSYEGQHFPHYSSSPSSSNDSCDTIGDQDDNSFTLRQKSRFQMPQRNCGEDIDFDVELQGKEAFKARNMYFIRQGEYFSMGISFAAALHNDLSDVFVRITPSWSVQRPEASTIIYCCDKHLENSPSAAKLEQYSMLRIDPGIAGTYDIDDASDRLTVLVPMASKDRTAPFWINLKSKCFSTCGSSQKKSHHLITVTLEKVQGNLKTVIGRKIFHTKFSSSPSRDFRNRSKGGMSAMEFVPPKRCDFGKKLASSLHKIKSPTRSLRSIPDDFGPENSQVTFLAVKKKYVERVKSYLKYLQNEDGDQESICESDFQCSPPLPDGSSDLESLWSSIPRSNDSSFSAGERQPWPQSFVGTPYAVSSIASSECGGNAAAEASMDDLGADLLSILEDCEPDPTQQVADSFNASFDQPANIRYSSFFLPETAAIISGAPLVAQSSTF